MAAQPLSPLEPKIERLDPALDRLIANDAKIEILASALGSEVASKLHPVEAIAEALRRRDERPVPFRRAR
jgi:hypothetical protein